MKRTEPFYFKFDKINEMLKKDPKHTSENICKCMLEAGFQVNDTFVAVCDEENETYVGIYPSQCWAGFEARTSGRKYYIEETKRLMRNDDYDEDYYWERTGDTLKRITECITVDYDSVKKTVFVEEYMWTIENCPSEEELDADLIEKIITLRYFGSFSYLSGSYAFDYDEIINKSNK